jgi:hypothetical protein
LTIQKLNDALKAHWRSVIAEATYEVIPETIQPNLLSMAGGDANRMRLIWKYLRLKQQFPMNFMEASNPTTAGLFVSLPPAPVFSQALRNKPVSPEPQSYESSVCLLLALSQGRKEAGALDPDHLASTELVDAGVFKPAAAGLKVVVDAWGRPLVFYRWPIGGEVAASNPNKGTTTSQTIANPLDPDALLMAPVWNNNALYAGRQGVWAFEKLFHPIHTGTGNAYKPQSFYTVPVIASAGPVIGGQGTIYELTGLAPPPAESAPPAVPPLPSALRHDPMDLASGKPDSQDNIYSFRMRLGARGD